MKIPVGVDINFSNKCKLFTFEKLKIIFWVGLILCTLLKVYFITPKDLSNDNFVFTYTFFTPDGYDWITNAKYLFISDDISYRQFGLVLIIKLLLFFNILGILPLINNFVLLIFMYSSYRLLLILKPGRKSEIIGLVLVLLLYFNYYLQSFANLVLADLYAITFISLAFLALFSHKKKLSFLLLGISWTFQNFSPFLFSVFILYAFITDKNKSTLRKHASHIATYSIIYLIPMSWWLVYKFLKFGNPFYTKVVQFELLSLNFNSLFYYGFNSLALYGFTILIVSIFLITRYREILQNKMLLTFVISIVITFIFWIILYDWDDRRFLLYFLPYIIPLVNFALVSFNRRIVYLTLIAVLSLVNTTIPVPHAKFERVIPMVPGLYIEWDIETGKISPNITQQKSANILPLNFLFESYLNRKLYRENVNTIANYYRNIITRNYDATHNTLCLDTTEFMYDRYIFNNIFKYISDGKDLSKVNTDNTCFKQ
jgi:hypothetical protein